MGTEVPDQKTAHVWPLEVTEPDHTSESAHDPEKCASDVAKVNSDIENRSMSWIEIFGCIFGSLVAMYVFLVGLTVMGSAFKVLGGQGASKMFATMNNPVAGMMVGVLATVLVQSSSTSTSIVVSLVASDIIDVSQGIPIVMGANIGTSVTNTIVSMGNIGNRLNLQRSFSGATVHDMFNWLAVCVLLPIEAIIASIQGQGGPLYWLTEGLTRTALGGSKGSKLPASPIKFITKPAAAWIVKSNKYVIYGSSMRPPKPQVPTRVCSTCQSLKSASTTSNCTRRLQEDSGDEYVQSLLSARKLAGTVDCSSYACVGEELSGYYKKVDKKAYAKLVPCDKVLPEHSCSVKENCYIQGAKYYDDHITHGKMITGGFLEPLGDLVGGVIGLVLSVLLLCISLATLCKLLQIIFMSKAKHIAKLSINMNGYFAIVAGAGITVLVQSSSVVTSALTPVCAIGVLALHKMFPITLGTNIGTTCTALIASLVDLKQSGVQIALCHFFFNFIGILIWFPIPLMRSVPINAAHLLGLYASFYRYLPAMYILIVFFALPGVALMVSACFNTHLVLGLCVLFVIIASFIIFELWWWRGLCAGNPGSFWFLSKEKRVTAQTELINANAAIMNVTPDEYVKKCELSWFG